MAIKWRKYLGTTNSTETEVSDDNPLPVTVSNTTPTSTQLNSLGPNISTNSGKQLKVTQYDSAGNEIQQGVTIEDLYKVLQEIRDGYSQDPTINKAANSRQATLITGSTTAVTGTLTGVTTVTGLTNIGGADASAFIKDNSFQAWAFSTRNLLN